MRKTVDIFEIMYNEYSSDNVCTIQGLVDKNISGDVAIPEELDGRKVTEIGFFRGYPKITSLVIPDSVEKCRYISQCDELKKIVFSKNMTEISSCSFLKNLEEVVIPDGIKKIGRASFMYCRKLSKAILPDSIEVIENNAFYECDSLKEIELPKNIKKLDATSFIWENVKTTEEGDAVYAGSKDNPHLVMTSWKDKNAVPVIADDVKIIGPKVYAGNLAVTDIKIKEGVLGISSDCFKDCKNLKSVELPSSIKVVSSEAFHGSHVEKVILNEGVEKIDTCAFWNIAELKSIEIPSSVKIIEQQAFESCGLEEVIFNEGLENIGNYAFQKCSKLKEVIFPASLKILPTCAFMGTGIAKATFKGTGVTFIDSAMFKDCVNLTTIASDTGDEDGVVNLPSSITKINNEAFSGCVSLKSVDLTKNVALGGVGERAFAGCTSLASVGWAPFVKQLQNEIFAGCSAIAELTLPKGISSIDTTVFDGAIIRKINYKGSLAEWAQIPRQGILFKKKFDLYIQDEPIKDLVVGEEDEVTVVSPYAFANANLNSIEIKLYCSQIGSGAFYGVGNLSNFTIEVGEELSQTPWTDAFVCEGGKEVISVDSINVTGEVSITADLFKGFKGAKTVKLGKSIKNVEKGALKVFSDTIKEVYLPFLGENANDNVNNYLGYVFGLDTYEEHGNGLPTTLKKVQVYNAKEIGKGAFYEVQLDELILPSDVEMIGAFAFMRIDSNLTNKYNGGYYVSLGENEYAVLVKVETDEKSFATAPDCRFITSYAFNKLPKLKEITISDTVVKIEPSAVEDCKKLGKVNLLNPIGWSLYNYIVYDKEAYSQKDASNAKRVAKDLKYGDGLIKLDVERKY